MTPCNKTLVLIGAMGSGKSHIAREVARLSCVPSRDIDALIVAQCGQSVAAVFKEKGEAEFRALETEVLRQALRDGGIIATGGGAVTQEANRHLLCASGVPVVYLRATPETLATRIRLQPGTRPLIDGDGALNHEQTVARVGEILRQRVPHYEFCAQHTVDTDGRTPRDVAQEILDALKKPGPID